ncbi:MAG: 50S ribosomal protein L24 [Candidatus Pacebacteria bacterium]|nr:50S ribosomal protein L24 [Candidatus Paceibacterota bacterium]
MKIKKGDQVLIIVGKDKGRKGKVLKSFPKENKIVVEGLNLIKKHQKPRKQGEKGQVLNVAAPLDVSNVKILCPRCGKPTRVGYKLVSIKGKSKKNRICKKCNSII